MVRCRPKIGDNGQTWNLEHKVNAATDVQSPGLLDRFKQARKKFVKRFGMRLIRRLRETLASQSLVSAINQFECSDSLKESVTQLEEVINKINEIKKNEEKIRKLRKKLNIPEENIESLSYSDILEKKATS